MKISSNHTAKIVLVGDCGVGKTSYIQSLQTEKFEEKYFPTTVPQVSQLAFHTVDEMILFDIWDTPGQKRFGGLKEECYQEINGAIIMFDVTSPETYRNVSKWYEDLTQICPEIPIMLVGNKIDAHDRVIPGRRVTFHKKHNMYYLEISSKSNYYLELPFLALARSILKDRQLRFISHRTNNLPPESIQEYNCELFEDILISPENDNYLFE